MNLSVRIAVKGYEDFIPYELVLEEGFSRVCQGELTVLTKTPRTLKDMESLLDQKISLTISQRLTGGLVSRSRYLHGIITGTVCYGAVNGGEGAACYRYGIVIESELARLRHTRLSSPYYRKTPADIIEEILAKYQIQGRFSDAWVDRSSFSRNLMFDQASEPDLDFVRRVMELYGLSWTFVHNPPPQSGAGAAELHFTEGAGFPPPFYEYSDKRKVPAVEKFGFVNYDEAKNLWKMEGWRMGSGLGVEGLEVNAPYPEANYGSRDWRWGETGPGKRYESRNSLFHGYERQTPAAEIDADVKRIIGARRLSLTLSRQKWTGKAGNIILMPGLLFELGYFYGPRDNNPLTALVCDVRLHIRALWPADMAAPPGDAETGELAEAEFRAVDWGRDSGKRYCGNNR
jgi:hypothetical protein